MIQLRKKSILIKQIFSKRNSSITLPSIIFVLAFITNVIICSSKPIQNARIKRNDEEIIFPEKSTSRAENTLGVATQQASRKNKPMGEVTVPNFSEQDDEAEEFEEDNYTNEAAEENIGYATKMIPSMVGDPKPSSKATFPAHTTETATEPVTEKSVATETQPAIDTDAAAIFVRGMPASTIAKPSSHIPHGIITSTPSNHSTIDSSGNADYDFSEDTEISRTPTKKTNALPEHESLSESTKNIPEQNIFSSSTAENSRMASESSTFATSSSSPQTTATEAFTPNSSPATRPKNEVTTPETSHDATQSSNAANILSSLSPIAGVLILYLIKQL